jgi:hypothetical protein
MTDDKLLKDPRLRIFLYMEKCAKLPVICTLVKIVHFLFVDLAPSLPKTRVFSLTERGRWQIFFSAYAVTFVFCFIVTAIWSVAMGTFRGNEANVRYFSDDWQNIVLYTVVCPAYVGLGTVLIASVVGGYWELKRLEEEVGASRLESTQLSWRVPAVIVFILTVAFVLTSLYISDVTNLEKVGAVYWFVEEVSPGQVRLTSLGVYYFLLNFTLLLITLVSLAFFMSAFAATVRVASALTAGSRENYPTVTLESMKTKLQTFVGAYLAAKLQVGAYILNFWIWQKSPLGNTANIVVAHVFLVLVGVFFLAIPRNYIELQWRRFRRLSRESHSEDLNVEHLVDDRAAIWATAIDTILIGSMIYIPFISDFMSY